MFGDGFKLAGGRWFDGAVTTDFSPLACWHNGWGSVLGRSYASGGFIDMVTESFAGPHDKANSYLWYVNIPQQVLQGLGMIGDALPADYYSPQLTRLLEYTINYTTSLAFATPFAASTILELSWATQSSTVRRRRP